VLEFAGEPGMAVAWGQLIFNVVMTLVMLLLLRIFHRRLEVLDTIETHAQERQVGAPR